MLKVYVYAPPPPPPPQPEQRVIVEMDVRTAQHLIAIGHHNVPSGSELSLLAQSLERAGVPRDRSLVYQAMGNSDPVLKLH